MSRRPRRLRRSRPLAPLALVALLAAPNHAQAVLETLTGDAADDRFGHSVANAGDVDGDGVDDVVIGSPFAVGGRGQVELYSGRTGGFMVGFTGGPGDELGRAVAGVGDITGDGRSEIAMSATGRSTPNGGNPLYDPVSIWDHAAGSFVHQQWSANDDDQGWSLAGGGDGNGDGVPDLLVGVPGHDAGGLVDAGRVLRLQMVPVLGVVPVQLAQGTQAGQQLGFDVAWLGDVDGASGDEFLAGSPFYDVGQLVVVADVGRVDAYRAGGTPLWNKTGSSAGGRFGWSVAAGVDISGNGITEAVVGVPWHDGQRGRVVVYHGHSGGFYASRDGDAEGDRLGYDVAPIVVDGAPHVLAGAPGDGENAGFTLLNPGVVHRLTGFALATTWSVKGGGSFGELGTALAVLGDMNADGSQEWAASQPFPVVFQTNEPGYVYLYDGETHAADASNYGAGLPGANGVPFLAAFQPPKLGALATIGVGNSSGAPTFAALFLGLAPASIPFKGGTLHVDPLIIKNLPNLPANGTVLPYVIPDDHTLSGLSLFLQSAQADPAALLGVSLSQGLRLDHGT